MPPRFRLVRLCTLSISVGFLLLPALHAADGQRIKMKDHPWTLKTGAAYTHSFDADVDNNSSDLSTDRLDLRTGLTYSPGPYMAVGVSLGYSHTDYDLHRLGGLDDPWDAIHRVSFGLPVRLALSREWALLATPSVRWTLQEDADADEAVTVGGMLGLLYRVSDQLRIGPGAVVGSQLEDDTRVIPIPLIDWQVSDKWRLRTGRAGEMATASGVNVTYQAAERTRVLLALGYEKRRMRLDDDGVAPDGVGQDRSMPLTLGVTHSLTSLASLAITGGMRFGGQLRLEDEDGHRIVEEDYDEQPFVGISLRLKF